MYSAHKDFLLAEYKASWDMILAIDNRRGAFLNYYALLFGAVASICGTIFARSGGSPPPEADAALFVLLTVTAFVGLAVIWVLNSERHANVRYRKRINAIRTLLLEAQPPADERQNEASLLPVAVYLQRETHDPKGVGRTLRSIFAVIWIQIVVALAGAGLILFYRLLPEWL